MFYDIQKIREVQKWSIPRDEGVFWHLVFPLRFRSTATFYQFESTVFGGAQISAIKRSQTNASWFSEFNEKAIGWGVCIG